MKNLKTLSIIAIVLVGLFATSCTPENLDNDQTEQQVDRDRNNRPAAKRIKEQSLLAACGSLLYYRLSHHFCFILTKVSQK